MKTLRRRIRVAAGMTVASVWRISAGRAGAEDRLVIIAHGAGGDMRTALIDYLHRELALRGCFTVKFNFPYAEQGRKVPDRATTLEQTWHAVLARVQADSRCASARIYLAGKSLGGRIASHVAGDVTPAGLVFLGFPLHAAGRPHTQRAAHRAALSTPMLFIQGTRDPLCDLALLSAVLRRLKAPHCLHLIDEGDHSFNVPRRRKRSMTSIWDEIVTVVDAWTAGDDMGNLDG